MIDEEAKENHNQDRQDAHGHEEAPLDETRKRMTLVITIVVCSYQGGPEYEFASTQNKRPWPRTITAVVGLPWIMAACTLSSSSYSVSRSPVGLPVLSIEPSISLPSSFACQAQLHSHRMIAPRDNASRVQTGTILARNHSTYHNHSSRKSFNARQASR